jgi:hypothetical protein
MHLYYLSIDSNSAQFFELTLLALKIFSVALNVFLLFLDTEVGVFRQANAHQLHEVSHRPLFWTPPLQVLVQENVLRKRNVLFRFHS